MKQYIHHSSGRLRFKFAQLRNQPIRAQMVASTIQQVNGVSSVEVSTLSGSLLIRYNANGAERDKLLASLERTMTQLGLVSALPTPVSSRSSQASASAAVLTDKLLDMVVQKCVERSALALLGIML